MAGLKYSKSITALFSFIICSSLVIQYGACDDSWEDMDDMMPKGSVFDTWDKKETGRSMNDESQNDDHAGHHSHADHANSNLQKEGAPPSYVLAVGGIGGQGANFAGHGEQCGPNNKVCWADAFLVCNATSQRCSCAPEYVYVRETESCWRIPKSDQESCGHDIQCQSGSFGHHSWCSKTISRCECRDRSFSNQEMKLVDGVCYVKKSVGGPCNKHEECNKTIHGEAYCKPESYQGVGGSYAGSCQCREGYMSWSPLNACLKIATKPNEKCAVTEQCQKQLQWARCTQASVCECYKLNKNQTEMPMVYYPKLEKCFVRREYNDSCLNADECKASLGPDVECGRQQPETTTQSLVELDARPRDVCYCPKGKVCRNGSMSSLQNVSLGTSLLAVLICKIGFAFLSRGV